MSKETEWTATFVQGAPEEWLPLVEIGTSGTMIGVSRSGIWLVSDANGCVTVSSERARVLILPLLEREAGPTRQACSRVLASQGIFPEGGVELPFLTAIRTAFSWHSVYWTEHALSWLEVVRSPQDIIACLEELVNASWLSQRARHRARQVLHKERARE